MLSGHSRQKTVFLWLAALAILCFAAAMHPDIRRHLPWIGPPAPPPAIR